MKVLSSSVVLAVMAVAGFAAAPFPKLTVELTPGTSPVTGKQTAEAQPESDLTKSVKRFEGTLLDLAKRAQAVVETLPAKPDELPKSFAELEQILTGAMHTVSEMMHSKPQIEQQSQKVLASIATVQQSFIDVITKIEGAVESIRREPTDNPQQIESVADALTNVKGAAERGSKAVVPLRAVVIEAAQKAKGVFAELSHYQVILGYALEVTILYKRGLGEPASFAAMVESLSKARDHLRVIIKSVTEAAQKADEAVRSIPSMPLEAPASL